MTCLVKYSLIINNSTAIEIFMDSGVWMNSFSVQKHRNTSNFLDVVVGAAERDVIDFSPPVAA